MRKQSRTFVLEANARASSDKASVMSHLLDPETWPAWQPEIITSNGPSPLDRGDVVKGNAQMLGFVGVEGRSVAVDVSDGAFEEEVVVGIGMRIRYEVRTEGDGSVVTQHLESDMPAGFFGRILSFMLRWRLRRLQRTTLERLVAQSEVHRSPAVRSVG